MNELLFSIESVTVSSFWFWSSMTAWMNQKAAGGTMSHLGVTSGAGSRSSQHLGDHRFLVLIALVNTNQPSLNFSSSLIHSLFILRHPGSISSHYIHASIKQPTYSHLSAVWEQECSQATPLTLQTSSISLFTTLFKSTVSVGANGFHKWLISLRPQDGSCRLTPLNPTGRLRPGSGWNPSGSCKASAKYWPPKK